MGICAAGCRGIATLLLILLLHCATFGQPSAAFTADTLSGCSPIVVHFTDQSTGNPSQWKWDLGNGVISVLQNPSTTYFNAGTYNVKLVVRNGGGSDSIVKSQLITVYPNPVVNFAASDTSGCFPFAVQFTDLSTTESGSIINHSWDFGDGDTSISGNPLHMYTTAGNFSVTVKVTNNYGCTRTFSKTKYIKVIEGVAAGFANTSPAKCTSPVTVNFTNTSTGPGSLSYTWNFGDGTSTDMSNPAHTYSDPGSYTVSLTTVSSLGCLDTITKVNLITVGSITSQFNIPDSVCQDQELSIINTTNPSPAGSSWDFGDGTTSSEINPVKKYRSPGMFVIKLVNQFSGCTDSINKSVFVKTAPTADFAADNTRSCKTPFTVQFKNQTAGNNTYIWDFGDGATSTDINPAHTYVDTGSYSVKLIVFNENGCEDTLVRQEYIQIRRPAITLNNLPQKGCIPLTISPGSTVVADEPVVNYLWDFGDGTTANVAHPTHTYTAAGTYTVSLVIATASGCTDTVVMPEAVRVGNKPHASFTVNPTDVCAFQAIQFTDNSTGNPDQWLWQFGDGGSSILQNPSYLYQDTGYFSVTLITWSNTCPDTIKLNNIVHIKPPIAKFTMERNCKDKYLVDFVNLSVGATNWSWDFGDGMNSNEQNPSHVYAATGIYQAVLTVTNGTCTHTANQEILIIDAKVDLVADNAMSCKGATIHFSGRNIDTTLIASWHWNFGDGDSSIIPATAFHNYNTPGTYTVSLAIQDVLGCYDTAQVPVTVFGPTARFSPSIPSLCLRNNGPIIFTDSSRSDGAHAILKWIWDYGDGTIDSTSSPPYTHLYSTAGSYDVSLTVADNYGCRDAVTNEASVVIADPKASFYSPDTMTCTDKPVNFVNTSNGKGLQYQWSFGDNQHSIDVNPIHHYSGTGDYIVSLFINDRYGCKDSISKKTYINVSTPKALFEVSDTFTSCPPLLVKFADSSLSYTSLQWDFDDGNHSNLENPSHYYTLPGTYFPKLIVTGPGGCTDSSRKKIDVRGPRVALAMHR